MTFSAESGGVSSVLPANLPCEDGNRLALWNGWLGPWGSL